MTNSLLVEEQVREDTLQVEIGVRVNGVRPDSPVCQKLGVMLVDCGREEETIQNIRDLVGLPPEFDVRIGLAEPAEAEETPEVIDPADLEIHAQGCVECSSYSWSKGCSSWPW